MKLLLITADTALARMAVDAGIDSVFVDLEARGKHERQGHLNTVISGHTHDDLAQISASVPRENVLVRIDPPHAGTCEQVESVVPYAGEIMLPMFNHVDEVRAFTDTVAGRATTIGLVETPAALDTVDEICERGNLDQIHFGLNDLSIALNRAFLFEVLADGLLDGAISRCRHHKVPFGIGGVGRIGSGTLPADLILAEHERLGSSAVILSRAFTAGAKTAADLPGDLDLAYEVGQLRERWRELSGRSQDERQADHNQMVEITHRIAREIGARR